MSRTALRRFALAGVAFALAAWIAFGRMPDRVDREQADAIARRLFAAYAREVGEPGGHFAARPTVTYPDGWEYGWTYNPCPALASLRVFIGRDGRAEYSETPDCAPGPHAVQPPARV